MVYYKSYRIVDRKPRWVIEDEKGNIGKNPTNDSSRGTKWDEFRFKEEIYNHAYQFILSNLEYYPIFKIKKEDNI